MAPTSSDVTAGTNATASQYNQLRADVNKGLKTNTTVSDGATITFDLSLGNVFTTTMAGNRTLAISNATVDQVFILRLVQDATGTRVPTFFTTIKWPAGTAPTLTTTANKTDVFGFIVTGVGTYDGFIIGQNL